MEQVAPEELAEAVLHLVRAGFGVDVVSIPVSVARLQGFGRTSEDLALRIQQEVDRMLAAGELQARDGRLVVS